MEVPANRTFEDVHRLVVEVLLELGVPRDRIKPDATIGGDIALESVAFVELQVALEDELGIEIDPVRIVELDALSHIVSYLQRLTTER